jgi:hypothetical protein
VNRRAAVLTTAAVAVAGALTVRTPLPASAGWADTATASAVVTTPSVSTPTGFACPLLKIGSISFAWNPVQGATAYVFHYRPAGGTVVDVQVGSATSFELSVVSSGTAWVTAKLGTWSTAASTAKSYTILLNLVSTCT